MYKRIYTTGEYIENNPNWHMEDSPWKAKQIIKMIQKNNLQIESVGEVGCGAGEALRQLQMVMPKNVNFFGYEISPQAFEFCQKISNERLKFELGNLPDKKNIFDLILCIDVFEHVEDYFSFLRKLRDKARYKIFHIPLDISVSSVLRSSPILGARKHVGHLHYFTKETALATLEDTGYEILDYFYTAGSIDLNIKMVKTFLARFPRQVLYTLNQDIAVRLMGGYSLLVLTK
jgi:2-polyprenyl-3-methyl-5-hydroxy-6-metoxy-1,4-benzoquinol methylase